MNINLKWILIVSLILLGRDAFPQQSRARLVVLADMGNEPDEEQQMTHMLLYANEFDLEGLIAVSGKYLNLQHRLSERQRLYPELFYSIIEAYGKVYDNLIKHDIAYPKPDFLKSIVASGHVNYGMAAVEKNKGNKGSELIIKSFEKNDTRPLYIVVNAGSNTLSQALVDYESRHTENEVVALLKKLWVFENGAQDDAGAWICANYPEINWMRSNYQTYAYGGPAWAWGSKKDDDKKGPHTWKPYDYSAIGQHQWALEHIKNHGALSRVYPLRETHEGKLVFIEGGGTIPWLGLVHKGLSDFTKPAWGGWGGRFSSEKVKNVYSRHESVRATEINYGDFEVYTEAKDIWTDTATDSVYNNIYAPVWRWRQAYFDDFKARMDWCLASYEDANHHPIAAIDGDKEEKIHTREAYPGETIFLDGSASKDPDGDALIHHWWIYHEAGSFKEKKPTVQNEGGPKASLIVPEEAKGHTIHVIYELKDDNEMVALTDYRRIILSVK